ncbi:MAG: thiamine-phosphate kinase [Acidobacteriota bacterium]
MTGPRRGEADWIRHIQSTWGPSGAEVDLGDDACVLPSARYAMTTDALLEGVDFERRWAPAEALGNKALAANLSDLAAVGARPRFLLLTLGIPGDLGDDFVEGLLEGMRTLARRESVGLCGGDLSASPGGLVLSLTLIGLAGERPLTRAGGRPGDALYVSGPVGGARAALRALKRGAILERFADVRPTDPLQGLLDRFYRPPGQTELGLALARPGGASCCIDVSDGLAMDLHRLCEASGCGAVVEAERIPVDTLAGGWSEESVREAILGGEDQVLLFAAGGEPDPARGGGVGSPFRIGRLVEGAACELRWPGGRSEPLLPKGFDHFAP